MSFSSVKFLGLSVADMKCSLGWGTQTSQINIKLIEDTTDGDFLVNPGYGQPVYFQFEGLRFYGLLQSLRQTNSLSGFPVYEAAIVDPREILDGAKIITGNYNGSIGNVRNLINAYGYQESHIGFGGAQSTPAGMPWYLVRSAVQAICDGGSYGLFGGPLTFMGNAFSLDLSELPVPPIYYRVTSESLSLLEAIQQVCDDSGCDFFVELIGFNIKVRVISRFHQPPLGTITELTSSSAYSGQCIGSDAGVEVRNENTSTFLIGGQKTEMFTSTSFASYWGNDIVGNPYIGVSGSPVEVGFNSGISAAVAFAGQYNENFNLNAADCADILGQVYYPCNTIEIRFALQGPESWASYIGEYKHNTVYPLIESLYVKSIPFAAQFQQDLINDSAAAVAQASSTEFGVRFQRLYDLVRRAGEDFYGKQYLVQVPDVFTSVDVETGIVTHSHEPTQSAWVEFGSSAFGIPFERSEIIEDIDGRLLPFVYYTNLVGANLSQLNWQDTIVSEAGEVWSRINVENKLTYVPTVIPVACVKVRFSNPLFDNPIDEYGDITLAGKVFAANALNNVNNNGFGGTMGWIGIHPACRQPLAVSIPFKSNIATYGPWYIAGAPGKVKFEKDESLTPWDYGNTNAMNLAANSRVLTSLTNQQLAESGSIEVAGAPSASLGDILTGGGPNITDMSIDFGVSGVKTQYRFHTFSQRFGLFSRQNTERMKRINGGLLELRKQVRKAINKNITASIAFERAKRGAKANKTFYTKKQSPHSVLMGMVVDTGSEVRVVVGTETYESSLNLLGTGTANYGNKAVMSLAGLIRPFSTNISGLSGSGLSGKLAHFEAPSGCFSGTNNPITHNTYNPFISGHDIEIITNGTGLYSGMHAYHRGADPANTRGVALRGPIVIQGWGYNTDLAPTPSGSGGGFVSNVLRRSDLWNVGELDPLWDNRRKLWTVHDAIIGTAKTNITGSYGPSGNTGILYVGGDSGWPIIVTNPFSGHIVQSGQKAIGLYCYNEHKYNLIYPGSGMDSGNYCADIIIPSSSASYCITGFLTGVYCSGGNVFGLTGSQCITVVIPSYTINICTATPINSVSVS